MFVRVKSIKGKPYLYLVENKWVKGKVRQAVKKYIGRVFDVKKVHSKDFFEFFSVGNVNTYVRTRSRDDIVKDLVALELFNHGFVEKSEGKWRLDNVLVNLNDCSIKIKKREAALKLNEGYLHSEMLKELLEFKPGRDKEISGVELAEMFVSAGVAVPQEVFVGLIMGKGFTQEVENEDS
ncbi:hypothetical protein KY328_03740 [Candidatus Woesearchaeota archaeon]|nr:hypothetical protein [Candidatus Woesearchaeota archaeon]MBW3022008.1 hypothetical protein [Candidatus Woesearchaeota archaeon]